MRLSRELCAVFVPGDPPRAGGLAVWGDGEGPDEIELVLPAGRGFDAAGCAGACCRWPRPCRSCWRPRADEVGPPLAARAAAAAAGVGPVARGRLLPADSPGGFGAWRVGPLDSADLEQLRRIAAMPPQAHALPVDRRRPLRLRSPRR